MLRVPQVISTRPKCGTYSCYAVEDEMLYSSLMPDKVLQCHLSTLQTNSIVYKVEAQSAKCIFTEEGIGSELIQRSDKVGYVVPFRFYRWAFQIVRVFVVVKVMRSDQGDVEGVAVTVAPRTLCTPRSEWWPGRL